MTRYFLDTSVIIEMIQENDDCSKYYGKPVCTSILNAAELNGALKKQIHPLRVDQYTDLIKHIIIEISLEDIKHAVDLRKTKKGMSFPDALGYTMSRRVDAIFVTSDSDFKGMKNVEFI